MRERRGEEREQGMQSGDYHSFSFILWVMASQLIGVDISLSVSGKCIERYLGSSKKEDGIL